MTRPLLTVFILLLSGCAGFCPIPGRTVENIDPGLLATARPRTPARTIDPGLLGQPRPRAHVVDTGDVLGVFIEGVLGDGEQGPPVTAPIQLDANGLTTVVRPAPEIGYPITVAQNGTITLPQKPPINVRGLTLAEVRAELRDLYVKSKDATLRKGTEKIVVTLQKPRTVRVLVVRKDRAQEPQFLQPPDYRRVEDGRGSGVLVELPIYENDVIHAIVASGGMPSQDAENAVRVVRAGGAWAGLGPVRQELCPGWSTSSRRPAQSEPSLFGGPIVQASAVSDHLGHSVQRGTGCPPEIAPAVVAPAVVGPQPAVVVRSPAFAAATPPMVNFGNAPRSLPCETSPFGQSCDALGCDGTSCDGQVGATRRTGPCKPALFGHGGLTGNCDAGGCDGGRCDDAGCGGCKPSLFGAGSSFCAQSSRRAGHAGGFGASLPADAGVALASASFCDMTIDNPNVRVIPLTLLPGECVPFDRCDVLLQDGDIVFVESRAKEFFYTSGLLGGGKYPLPRDEDLDLLDAIALADSQRRVVPTKSVGGVSSLNQDVTVGASRVIVYREAPDGRRVPIRLNLNEIKRNPNRSIVILPGDRIYLQYTRLEAVAAGFERHFLDGTVLGIASGITFSE